MKQNNQLLKILIFKDFEFLACQNGHPMVQ